MFMHLLNGSTHMIMLACKELGEPLRYNRFLNELVYVDEKDYFCFPCCAFDLNFQNTR